MDLNQLSDLDFSDIGNWPVVAKAVLVVFLCGVVAGGWYWFVTLDQLDNLTRVEARETELRASFEAKQRLAANLEIHREQLVQIEEFLTDLLRQLPGSAEIAALLVDVSQTGLAAGLEFDLFRPAGEVSKSFYAELPIQVEVTGTYHDLGRFASGLAALSRIVTVHDVVITSLDRSVRGAAAASKLRMQATVKTYRYIEDEETKKAQETKQGGKAGQQGKAKP
ncbi:MAG: type 4a pilus biogenesis protein PilO [Chromatiaceae bacterium]